MPRVLLAIVVLLGGIAVTAAGTWQLLDVQGFAAFQDITTSRIDKILEGHPEQAWFRMHIMHRALPREAG